MARPVPAVFEPRERETWRDPFSMYRALRDGDPAHHVEDGDYWVLSRFGHVFEAGVTEREVEVLPDWLGKVLRVLALVMIVGLVVLILSRWQVRLRKRPRLVERHILHRRLSRAKPRRHRVR